MTSAESERLLLYNRLQEVLGADPATTLMSHLPFVDPTELLTRSVFEARFAKVDERFEQIDQRFDRLEVKLDTINTRIDRILLVVVGGMLAIIAAVLGAGGLF